MEEINKYHKRFDWDLNMAVFDFESVIAMSMNFNIIPQCVLILRNFFCINNPLNGKDFFQRKNLYISISAGLIFTTILLRSLMKYVLKFYCKKQFKD